MHTRPAVLALLVLVAGAVASTCTLSMGLNEAAQKSGRYFGGCLAKGYLTDTKYVALADKHFGITTAENECKMDATEPTSGTFSFTSCDAILSHAQANNMKFRGHTLVWHSQVPTWMTSLTTAAAKRAAIVSHIKGVLSHYKGKVYAWDVVNEAVADTGTALRTSNWYPDVPDFIDLAFNTSRAADPSAKLFYNDYGADGYSQTKATYIYNMVKSMVQRGIPIDGVGFQMHLGTSWSLTEEDHRKNFQRYADLGLEVHITEADVSCSSGSSDWTAQAETFARVARACGAVSTCKSFEVWGVTDSYSWLGSAKTGLVFDSSYTAKPAACSILEALLAASTTATTSSSSSAAVPATVSSQSHQSQQASKTSSGQAKSSGTAPQPAAQSSGTGGDGDDTLFSAATATRAPAAAVLPLASAAAAALLV
eukprot:m51a1_g10137 putative endo- -beta-xylanase (424) ;mRNA; f:32619-33960